MSPDEKPPFDRPSDDQEETPAEFLANLVLRYHALSDEEINRLSDFIERGGDIRANALVPTRYVIEEEKRLSAFLSEILLKMLDKGAEFPDD